MPCSQMERMESSLEAVKRSFSTVRTGRASPAMLDRIEVSCSALHAAHLPINQSCDRYPLSPPNGLPPGHIMSRRLLQDAACQRLPVAISSCTDVAGVGRCRMQCARCRIRRTSCTLLMC